MKPAAGEVIAQAFWRRLDTEGHDRCCLLRDDDKWIVEGMAVFHDAGEDAAFSYRVVCGDDWSTLSAAVAGRLGRAPVDIALRRDTSGWTLNGVRSAGIEDCVDVDLGFTPATNILPLRRLRLSPGVTVETAAAYLAFPALSLSRLAQTYRRIDATRLAYASPTHAYSAKLSVSAVGFVTDYPGLWSGHVRER